MTNYIAIPDNLLADWTIDEIRGALDASLTNPDCVLRGGTMTQVPRILIGEWMKRDLTAALAWFEGLGSSATQQRFANYLSDQWPPDKAPEGLAFLRKHRDLFRSGNGTGIIRINLNQAASAGPAALAGILKLCHDEQLHEGRQIPIEFPADFDFTLLLANDEWQTSGDDPLLSPVIRTWQSRDPDLAFDWVLGQKGPASLLIFTDAYTSTDRDAGKWLAPRIEDLRADEQREFLDAAKARWIKNPFWISSFARGLRDPLILDEVAAWGAQAMFHDMENGLAAIEQIPGIERRVELLEGATQDEKFGYKMAYHSANDADKAQLRKKLTEWNVEADRIEAIVSRYRP